MPHTPRDHRGGVQTIWELPTCAQRHRMVEAHLILRPADAYVARCPPIPSKRRFARATTSAEVGEVIARYGIDPEVIDPAFP